MSVGALTRRQIKFAPTARLGRALGGGIVAREFRAAAPAMFAMAALHGLATGALLLTGNPWNLGQFFRESFILAGVIQGFLAGVLCGAEEIENGTIDFGRRAPISTSGFVARKIVGALLGLAFGLALTAAALACLPNALEYMGRPMSPAPSVAAALGGALAPPTLLLWALNFAAALAAGAWIGRVILATIVGGLAVALLKGALDLLEAEARRQLVHNPLHLSGMAVHHEAIRAATMIAVIVLCLPLAGARLATATATTRPPRLGRWFLDRLHGGGGAAMTLRTKDRRRSRPILFASAALAVLGLASGEAAGFVWIVCLLLSFILGPCALGVTFLSGEEHDAVGGLVYSLPIARGQILREKLWGLLGNLAVISFIFWICMLVAASRELHPDAKALRIILPLAAWGLLAPIAVALVAATLSLYFRSFILAVILTPVFGGPALYFALSVGFSGAVDPDGPFARGGAIRATLQLLALILGLAWWLRRLYTRAAIHEWRPGPRSLLGLLFGATLVELAFAIFLCGWRDLAFLILGV